MMLQLTPPIPVWIPSKRLAGMAHALIDDGIEHDALWVVIQADGEVWTYRQSEVRGQANATLGRPVTP